MSSTSRPSVLVLVSRELFERCLPTPLRQRLEELADVVFPESDLRTLDEQTRTAELQKHDILLGGWGACPLPKDYRPVKRQLWCQLTGSVTGQITPEHLERGLRLTNWGDAISHTVAEAALTLILACVRAIGEHYHVTHIEKGWHRPKEFRCLFDRNVGLVGFGRIARQLTYLLRPFRTRVFGYDPYVDDEVFVGYGVRRVQSLEDLFRCCDIISLHAARTTETNRLVDARLLGLLPDHGVLAAEHARGRLYSGLDVFDPEPPAPDHPLRNQPRCIMTCHRAGPTTDQYDKMGRRAVENIRRFLEGRPLIDEITPEMLLRMT